jgi:hypothetical protein
VQKKAGLGSWQWRVREWLGGVNSGKWLGAAAALAMAAVRWPRLIKLIYIGLIKASM